MYSLFGCTSNNEQKNLRVTYTSEMITNLEGENSVGQLQLSFDENDHIYISQSSTYIETGTYIQNENYLDLYTLQFDGKKQNITLKDDNSFYIRYTNQDFQEMTIQMKFSMDARLGPKDSDTE